MSALSATAVAAVATTTLAVGAGPAAAANGLCQGAASYHCYAITRWGPQVGQPPVSFSEIGADMEVDCLSIFNLSTDFINYEMWMVTNTNFSHPQTTWVEQGYKNGRGFNGLPTVTSWRFWADQRNTSGAMNYAEHYIGNTTTGQYIDTGFQWVPNTNNWRVYNNHTQVGTSVNVGAWAGGADAGLEATDTQSAGVGNTSNWRYKDGVNGTFHPAPVGIPVIDPSGFGTVNHTGAQENSHTSNNCSYPPQARTAGPRSISTTQAVNEVAPEFAKGFGDASPASTKAVATTRSAANRLQNADVKGDEPVTLLQMTGDFDAKSQMSLPYGAKIPEGQKGNTLTAVIDQATGQLLDWSLTSQTPSLTSLGQVVQK